MRYLLDTNTISHILRHDQGFAARRLDEMQDGDVGTSIIVAAELRFGYAKRPSARLVSLVEEFLDSFPVLEWSEPCDRRYGTLRADLENRGELIGYMDMLIAAHALTLDAVMVTDNEREFRRVPGLKVENWIR